MATKHTNFMRATIWTPTMKLETSGSPDSGIVTAFHALTSAKRRAACLKSLQVIDAEMTLHEEALATSGSV